MIPMLVSPYRSTRSRGVGKFMKSAIVFTTSSFLFRGIVCRFESASKVGTDPPPVMLSAAKNPHGADERVFAALSMTGGREPGRGEKSTSARGRVALVLSHYAYSSCVLRAVSIYLKLNCWPSVSFYGITYTLLSS